VVENGEIGGELGDKMVGRERVKGGVDRHTNRHTERVPVVSKWGYHLAGIPLNTDQGKRREGLKQTD
jgi:hypothetical protein